MHTHAPSDQPLAPVRYPGCTRLWLADNQVICYRFTETPRTTVDACVEDVRSLLLGWNAARYWRLLLDIRHEGALISAYGLHRGRELTRLRPDVRGKLAILTSSAISAQIASLALRGFPNENRRRVVFSAEADAIAWLLRDDRISHQS